MLNRQLGVCGFGADPSAAVRDVQLRRRQPDPAARLGRSAVQSILSLYSILYGNIGATYRAGGDTATAVRADSVAKAVNANFK